MLVWCHGHCHGPFKLAGGGSGRVRQRFWTLESGVSGLLGHPEGPDGRDGSHPSLLPQCSQCSGRTRVCVCLLLQNLLQSCSRASVTVYDIVTVCDTVTVTY